MKVNNIPSKYTSSITNLRQTKTIKQLEVRANELNTRMELLKSSSVTGRQKDKMVAKMAREKSDIDKQLSVWKKKYGIDQEGDNTFEALDHSLRKVENEIQEVKKRSMNYRQKAMILMDLFEERTAIKQKLRELPRRK
ncbi:hypothetical protein HP567_028800 [Brevibacillus sp. M2.1A]|uniref:hypothetical protein n=1 Tax=Brevibacillus sp. M2.1A TaxID=2738980 RepID=UPI00156B94F7|nr:hypothetical protein [Brevibacillus sp. M2.1A]MCC8438538.1 hypothetical protein [Brevibacillus sp. M2.1A]